MGFKMPCLFFLRNRHGYDRARTCRAMSIPKKEWTWVSKYPCPFFLRNRHGYNHARTCRAMSVPKGERTWVSKYHVHSSLGIDMSTTVPGPAEPCLFLRRNGHGFQNTHVHSSLGIDMGTTMPGSVEPCMFLRDNRHGFQNTHVHSFLGTVMGATMPGPVVYKCQCWFLIGNRFQPAHAPSCLDIYIGSTITR